MTQERLRPGSAASHARRHQRREELLNVATQLFYKRGYDSTTLQDIADQMGFTKQAIYYYATSKEELLVASYRRIVEPAIERARSIAESGGSGATRFHEAIRVHLETVLLNIEANAVFDVHLSSLSRTARREIGRLSRSYYEILARIYDAGRSDGTLVDVEAQVAVNGVLGMCNSTHRWYERSDGSVAGVIDDLVRLIRRGIDALPEGGA